MNRFTTCLGILSLCVSASVLCSGCKDTKVTEKTEIKERIGGGEKVERTKVIETNDTVRVEKDQTKIGHDGQVQEQKKTVTEGEKIK